MRTLMTGSAVAALVGTALTVMTPLPASAQLARPQTAASISGDNTLLTDVQWRRGGYGWRGGRGYYGHRRYYGPGIGLGLGLATGAIIGGALASPYYYAPAPRVYEDYDDAPTVYRGPAGGNAVAYCMQRFKSYDPSSGTYLGYDGQRHPCP